MLVTGRGEEGGNQSKPAKEGVIQFGEGGSTRRKTGSGKEVVQGESKAKAGGNQQQVDSKVKGTPAGSQGAAEGGGSSPAVAASGAAGGSDQLQENGNRWLVTLSLPFISKHLKERSGAICPSL